MFCCYSTTHEQELKEEAKFPPNFQKISQSHRHFTSPSKLNESQVQPFPTTHMHSSIPKQYFTSPQRSIIPYPTKQTQLLQSFSYRIQTVPLPYKQLRQQNKNNKVSLSRKRNDFNSKFKLLESRVSELKTAYSQKSCKMQDITQRINYFVEGDKQRIYYANANRRVG